MRDPIISLKRSDLLEFLRKQSIQVSMAGHEISAEAFVDGLMLNTRPHTGHTVIVDKTLSNRKLTVHTLLNTPKSVIKLFQSTLSVVRGIKGLSPIRVLKSNDVHYNDLINVVNLAVEYCDYYKLPYNVGFNEYIWFSLDVMDEAKLGFYIGRIAALHSKIFKQKQDIVIAHQKGDYKEYADYIKECSLVKFPNMAKQSRKYGNSIWYTIAEKCIATDTDVPTLFSKVTLKYEIEDVKSPDVLTFVL
jgi:hypothetical protein